MIGVKIDNLYSSYGKTSVLKGISFSALTGKITTIIGPNGTGKSTLLKSIAGVIKSSGSIEIKGVKKEQLSLNSLKKMIGYMTQTSQCKSNLSVFEMVLLGRLQSLSIAVKEKDLKKTWLIINKLKLEKIAHKPYTKLSGGQQRLVSIAQTLVSDPEILILDEPTANLDIKRELEVLDVIKRYTSENEITTIMTLHDLNTAMRWSDKIILLEEGSLLKAGVPHLVLSEQTIEKAYGIKSQIIDTDRGEKVIIPRHYQSS